MSDNLNSVQIGVMTMKLSKLKNHDTKLWKLLIDRFIELNSK